MNTMEVYLLDFTQLIVQYKNCLTFSHLVLLHLHMALGEKNYQTPSWTFLVCIPLPNTRATGPPSLHCHLLFKWNNIYTLVEIYKRLNLNNLYKFMQTS